jgi:hypothetical protein
MSFAKEIWLNLSSIDCSEKIEKKMNLSYLSWAWAWESLMGVYPESCYEFKDPIKDDSGTVEIWCNLTVKDGEKELNRQMWLPVMDHKNKSIVNPTSRDISDCRMRCLVKCLAMFGLGHYIYAGEDLPNQEAVKEAGNEKYKALCDKLKGSIDAIKNGIENNELSSANEAWSELTEEEKVGLWRAPSKGGVFTTKEREIMKSTEFRESGIGADE